MQRRELSHLATLAGCRAGAKMTIEQTISNAGVILAMINRYQRHGEDGIIWTARMLANMCHLELDATEKAIAWLYDRCYICKYKTRSREGEIIITTEGREYLESAPRRPFLGTEKVGKWRDEARSGIRVVAGRAGDVTIRSDIDRAVLPSGSPDYGSCMTPEDLLSRYQSDLAIRQRLADRLGLDLNTATVYLSSGRIRHCKRCGNIGVFDRNGKSWRNQCRKCRAKK